MTTLNFKVGFILICEPSRGVRVREKYIFPSLKFLWELMMRVSMSMSAAAKALLKTIY